MFFLPIFGGWTGTHIPVQPPSDTLGPFISEHNFLGVELRPKIQPPLVAFISEPYFSGLNWDPHPGSTPHWYLASLNTTFRGWTQTQGSTPHWWLSSLNPTFRGWTRTHIPVQPRTNTFHLWTQLFGVELRPEVQPRTDGFHLWTSLFGVELGPTSWFNPPLSSLSTTFRGWTQTRGSTPHWWLSSLNLTFWGCWDPHPGSTPHWYLSSLSTTFRGWTQTRGSTPHWWLSSLNLTFWGWTGTHILVQPPTDTFHLWAQLFGVELRPEVQPATDGLTFRGWTGTHIPVQPPTDTFHLWAQLFGVQLRPEVQPATDGFHLWTSLFGVEPMPKAINMAYGGHTASINLLSTKQTVGIQTETEPISGSSTLRERKRTQTNQRLAVYANMIWRSKLHELSSQHPCLSTIWLGDYLATKLPSSLRAAKVQEPVPMERTGAFMLFKRLLLWWDTHAESLPFKFLMPNHIWPHLVRLVYRGSKKKQHEKALIEMTDPHNNQT